MSAKRVAVVVLAAGKSARMGTPKQLLEIEGKTLLRRTVETALASDTSLVVVALDAQDPEIGQELGDLPWTLAAVAEPHLGQSESIRAALEAVTATECEAILFTPCDLPLLSPHHLNALMAKYRNENALIVASHYSEILGAPLVIDRILWPELRQLRGDVGARKILARHDEKTDFIDWPEGAIDLDTPQDLERFKSVFSENTEQ